MTMRPYRPFFAPFLLLGALLTSTFLAACRDDATAPPPDPPRATTITVSPAATDLTALGATVQLSAEVMDQNGQVMTGATVTWASGTVGVATVSHSGLVTAVANGNATIAATSGSALGRAAVTVMQSVDSVAVQPAEASFAAVGDTVRLAAEAHDANGNTVAGAEFSWESGDEAVATVSASGLVTAAANGSATITATSGSALGSAMVTVAQEIVVLTVLPAHLTSAQAGKQGADTIEVTVLDGRGSPVAGARYRWSTDLHSGWVYAPHGITDDRGRFRTTWVAGSEPANDFETLSDSV